METTIQKPLNNIQQSMEKANMKVSNINGNNINGNNINSVKKTDFLTMFKAMEPEIRKALPSHLKPERIIRVAMTMYRENEKLKECDPLSIISSIIISSQLGLELNTPLGHAFIIPYGGKASFQIGYKGTLELCYRTNMYKSIYAHPVYENDEFSFEFGLNQKLIHKPNKNPIGEPIYYYAIYKTLNGGEGMIAMSKEEVILHAKKYSKNYNNNSSIWKTDFNSMALKTVLKKVLAYAPKSSEIIHAEKYDGEIVDIKDLYKDNAIDINNIDEKNI